MIYRERGKKATLTIINDDCRNVEKMLYSVNNAVVVTDPPFNIGYHYRGYKDRMKEADYYDMLSNIVRNVPSIIIHYPEQLHRLTLESGVVPSKVVSWVYNSNTAKQHRDIGFYNVIPNFKNVLQPYKNPNDKRVKQLVKNGKLGGGYMIGGM